MNFLLILLCSSVALGAPSSREIEDTKKSVESLIRPLLPGMPKVRPKGIEDFSLHECKKEDINWMKVLFTQEEVTLVYKFKPGCDIEGTLSPRVLKPFPADFKIRNIQSYSRFKSVNQVTADLQQKPILKLSVTNGLLTGKYMVKFKADYRVQLNPLSKDPLEKNLGGELRITEINGKKVNIQEKILVK